MLFTSRFPIDSRWKEVIRAANMGAGCEGDWHQTPVSTSYFLREASRIWKWEARTFMMRRASSQASRGNCQ